MFKYLTLLIVKFCWIYIWLIYIRQINSMNQEISEVFDFNLVVLYSRWIRIQIKLSQEDLNPDPAIC